MKVQLYSIFFLTTFFACCTKKDNFNYKTNIASITYKSELTSLNTTLKEYANMSDIGIYYYIQDSILNFKGLELKNKARKEHNLSHTDLNDLLKSFKISLKENYNYDDAQNINEINKSKVVEASDIDLILLLFKRTYVSKLKDNKFFPFNTVSINANVENKDIQNGEEFKMQLNLVAANDKSPAEWYIIKDMDKGLTKGNIDTLFPDEFGWVSYKTKKYQLGNNQINYVTKFKGADGYRVLSYYQEFKVH